MPGAMRELGMTFNSLPLPHPVHGSGVNGTGKWWRYDLPGKRYGWMRFTGRYWQVCFTEDGAVRIGPPIPYTAAGGVYRDNGHFWEFEHESSRAAALVFIRQVYDIFTAPDKRLTLDELDPVTDAPDLIGFKLRVDQVSKVTHPKAGTRYTLALDNLTEAEARSALDHIRATGRMEK